MGFGGPSSSESLARIGVGPCQELGIDVAQVGGGPFPEQVEALFGRHPLEVLDGHDSVSHGIKLSRSTVGSMFDVVGRPALVLSTAWVAP